MNILKRKRRMDPGSILLPAIFLFASTLHVTSALAQSAVETQPEWSLRVADATSNRRATGGQPVRLFQNANQVVVINQKLSSLLRSAGRRNNVQMKIARGVRGSVRNETIPSKLPELLDSLSRSQGLAWYQLHGTIYISRHSDNTSRMISLGNTGVGDFREGLAAAGLDVTRFELKHLSQANSVMVSGPITYLANVELIAEAMNKNKHKKSNSVVFIKGGRITN